MKQWKNGSAWFVPNDEYLTAELMREAEVIICGIQAIAEKRETENRPRLGTIIEAFHDSEINGGVSSVFRWDLARLFGDPGNGIDAEDTICSPQEAAEWLRANEVHLENCAA